ncbi:MAG: hypothetical protein ACOZAL_00640 [Patescibacteria group bacterium]
MEKNSNQKIIKWGIGIIFVFILGLFSFLLEGTYSGINERLCEEEKKSKVFEKNNLILNAKMDVLLRQAGVSEKDIEKIEKQFELKP